MRSPVIAYSLFAAAVVGPSLVAGAPPASPKPEAALAPSEAAGANHHVRDHLLNAGDGNAPVAAPPVAARQIAASGGGSHDGSWKNEIEKVVKSMSELAQKSGTQQW